MRGETPERICPVIIPGKDTRPTANQNQEIKQNQAKQNDDETEPEDQTPIDISTVVSTLQGDATGLAPVETSSFQERY